MKPEYFSSSVRCFFSSLALPFLFVSLLSLSGCIILSGCSGAPLSGREKGVLTGGAIGSGLGAIIGNQSGNSGAGIAIGAAAGALAGGLIGNNADNTDAQNKALEERQRRQDEEIQRQRRELEELRRQRDTY